MLATNVNFTKKSESVNFIVFPQPCLLVDVYLYAMDVFKSI